MVMQVNTNVLNYMQDLLMHDHSFAVWLNLCLLHLHMWKCIIVLAFSFRRNSDYFYVKFHVWYFRSADIEDPGHEVPTEVTVSIPNLEPSTSYFFRIQATNENEVGETESEWTVTNGTTKGRFEDYM